jgi:hypothetical protein
MVYSLKWKMCSNAEKAKKAEGRNDEPRPFLRSFRHAVQDNSDVCSLHSACWQVLVNCLEFIGENCLE